MYKQCKSCGRRFRPVSQVMKQQYCSRAECQRSRKRSWQKAKRKNDQDYRENQRQAQKAWLLRNPHYWRDYRRKKASKIKSKRLVELDLVAGVSPIPNGFYRLTSMYVDEVAKMDEWIVEIKIIPHGYDVEDLRKERT